MWLIVGEVMSVGREKVNSFLAKPGKKKKNLEPELDLKLKTLLSILNIFGISGDINKYIQNEVISLDSDIGGNDVSKR